LYPPYWTRAEKACLGQAIRPKLQILMGLADRLASQWIYQRAKIITIPPHSNYPNVLGKKSSNTLNIAQQTRSITQTPDNDSKKQGIHECH